MLKFFSLVRTDLICYACYTISLVFLFTFCGLLNAFISLPILCFFCYFYMPTTLYFLQTMICVWFLLVFRIFVALSILIAFCLSVIAYQSFQLKLLCIYLYIYRCFISESVFVLPLLFNISTCFLFYF